MELIKVNSVQDYNDLFGFETLHPLVNVVEFTGNEPLKDHKVNWGVYTLFLKKTKGCVINYGKTKYDYDDETVVSFAPGQVSETHIVPGSMPKSIGLIFHPDFLHRTALAAKMKSYTFFSYSSNEALHLSPKERVVISHCFEQIKEELQYPIDKYSKNIVISNIELLLDYCLRFYSRQFITREELNCGVLSKFEQNIDTYLADGTAQRQGIPNVAYFADKLNLSPNYFGDLIKRETGKTAQEYIQLKLVGESKNRLLEGSYNVSEIAYSLGFQYPQHFIRFFKRQTGVTPKQYQMAN